MKFLFFNLAVIAALAYLIAGDNQKVSDMADQVMAKTADTGKELMTKVKALSNNSATESRPSATQVQTPAAKRAAAAGPVKIPEGVAPPPRPSKIEVAERKTQPVPRNQSDGAVEMDLPAEVQSRRAEVLDKGPHAAVPEGAAANVSASDRKRSLLNLAERMELFHLQSVSR